MEKNFTLMKTMTAFRDLLFPRRKRNFRTINNELVSTIGGCSTETINNHLIYVNDPDMAGSFLFFENAAIIHQPLTMDAPQSTNDDQKIKSEEESQKVNDELAQRNIPKPVYNNWRGKVNDDLAACTAVDDPLVPPLNNSYKRKNDNINVDHIFTINHTTTVNNETKTNKNDAFLPFASFCSLFTEALARVNFRRLVHLNFNKGESFSVGGFSHKQLHLILIPARL